MDNVLAALKEIKLFVLDVDGVLTNATILLTDSGEQLRTMNIKDGYALQLAIKKGFRILVISGAVSLGVEKRLLKLGISEVHMGVKDKKTLLQNFMAQHQLLPTQVLAMGDDMPDVEMLKIAGIAACPKDAVPQVKALAHYICTKNGGEGCVREIIEKTLTLQQQWNEDDATSIASI